MTINEEAIAALEQSNELFKLAIEELSNLDISNQMTLLYALIEQKKNNGIAISNIKMDEILSK
jgi:ABC-type dipeptide/oligopeptide/nickel transport system ATPase subunit